MIGLSLLGGALAGTLSGLLVGEDGVPVAGADVVAYLPDLSYASTVSGSDGAWTIRGLADGRYRIRALPDDDDPHVDGFHPSAWDYCDAAVVPLEGDAEVDGLDVVLAVGGTLSGRLVGADGEAAGPGQVLARGQSARTGYVSRLAAVDSDGRFTLAGLDAAAGTPEPYAVYVGLDGWPYQYLGQAYSEGEAALFDVGLGEGVEAGEQVLLPGITVSGTVRGPEGPVADGTAYVFSGSQAVAVPIESDGTYLADGLPTGSVIAWAAVAGLATSYYPDADRPGASLDGSSESATLEGVDLTLPLESSLTVRLAGEGDLSDASVLVYNDTYTVGRGAPFEADGSVTIDALHDATYYVYVYGEDVGMTDDFVRGGDGLPLAVTVAGDTAVDVTMPLGARFGGTVRDEAGAPIAGAYVYATDAAGEDGFLDVTDEDGTFRIGGLAADRYVVRAYTTPYCPNDPGYTASWWPDARGAGAAEVLTLDAGEARDDLDFTLATDDDHDGMGDTWESANGLDPSRDDAAEDADGDGALNLEEWVAGTDPVGDASDEAYGCGCGAGSGALALLPLALVRRRRSAACTAAPRSRALRW